MTSLQTANPNPPPIDGIFRALSDPTRRCVVERLNRSPASVSELAEPFDMALPSFIEHLRVLEGCGLVRSQKSGRVRTYQLAPEPLKLAENWLAEQRTLWESRLDQFDAYVMTLKEQEKMSYPFKPDPRLDLVLERVVDAPRELLWRAWTTPEHVKQWFTPKPWSVTDCEIDLRPGGLFRTRMQSPDGKEVNDRHCCYLEIVPNERLVWTDALLPGYRPSGEPFITAVISLRSDGKGTRYTATAIHRDEATRKNHEELGFFDGWGTVADQLAEYVKTI